MMIPEKYGSFRLELMTYLNDPSLVHKISEMPYMTRLEDRRKYPDGNYRCAQYVFGRRNGLNEAWARPGWDMAKEFWTNTEEYLAKRGYVILDEFRSGAVVGYRFHLTGRFEHFGFLKDDGTVDSKWGSQDPWNHGIFSVPLNWGDEVLGIYRVPKPRRFRILGISIG